MQQFKPLTEVIAELQKIADANPGILTAFNDQEHGLLVSQVTVAHVYLNHSEQPTILDEFTRIKRTQIAKEYSEKTAKEMWDSMVKGKENWKDFEAFEKSFNYVKLYALKDVAAFEKAVTMVVFESSDN